MSISPVRLNTKHGVYQYDILSNQLLSAKKNSTVDEFKERCKEDLEIQERYMEYFLDDEVMSRQYPLNEDDKEGFIFFNEQSDVCTCLRYFSGGVM